MQFFFHVRDVDFFFFFFEEKKKQQKNNIRIVEFDLR